MVYKENETAPFITMRTAETQANFIMQLPEGFVATVENNPLNPQWQLYQVLQDRGYNLRPTESRMSNLGIDIINIYCDNGAQRSNIRLRVGIISSLPDFKFLNIAYTAYSGLSVVESIVQGRVMEERVQVEVPGTQHITLSEQDRKQALAGLYAKEETHLEGFLRLDRGEIQELNGVTLVGDDSQKREAIVRDEARLAEIRRKQQELGAEPISVERIREIVSSLADRVENLIAPTPQENSLT